MMLYHIVYFLKKKKSFHIIEIVMRLRVSVRQMDLRLIWWLYHPQSF